MSRNGSGTYTLPAGNPVVTGTTITSSWANTTMQNIADGLTQSVASDGQTPMSGALNMATNKITSLGTPTLSTDAVTKAYADALIAGGSTGVFTSVTDSGLTTGRVTYASTGGLLTDSSAFTYDGTTVTSTKFAGAFNGSLGATTPSTGSFTTLAYSSTFTGGTGVVNLGSGQFYKDASGNVGIGTSSPGAQLDQYLASGTTYRYIRNGSVSVVEYASTTVAGASYGTITNHPLIIITNNTERIRIDTSGNVGIGTSSPGNKLNVVGGRTDLAANSETYALGVRYNSGTGIYYIGATNSATPDMVFSQVGGSERMRITNDGNVGIGTTSPFSSTGWKALSINGTTYGLLELLSGGTSYGQIYSATNVLTVNANGASSVLAMQTNGTERMRIDSSGNVGIGTSSPSASAILDAQSTTKGVRMPNMTTTQKNAISSPAAGLMVFDTTLAKLCVYTGSAWQTITSV
jgi:hypothetical protein